MSDDESYVPEVEATYSDAETDQAMQFIKDNELPMSDLHYALKYVRISNRCVALDNQYSNITKRLQKLREEDIAVVKPPPPGWSGDK